MTTFDIYARISTEGDRTAEQVAEQLDVCSARFLLLPSRARPRSPCTRPSSATRAAAGARACSAARIPARS